MNVSDSLNFNVSLQSYNGPLEVLLDLAKSQKLEIYLLMNFTKIELVL